MAILKIPRLWGAQAAARATAGAGPAQPDGLEAFGSESLAMAPGPAPALVGVPAPAEPSDGAWRRWPSIVKWTVVIAATAAVAVAGVIGYQRRFTPKPTTGSLTVETTPAGLDVVIAGKSVGRTPLTLPLSAGTYELEVGPPEARRLVTATVAAGATSVQHLEFPVAAAASSVGTLRVTTEPASVPVVVDGIERGASPVTIEGLAAGAHEVLVRTGRETLRRAVTIQAGGTLSLVVSAPAADAAATPAATGGWLSVASPIAMQLREGGKVIGTTEADRIMLPAGDHDVDIVNEPLGFRTSRHVRIAAGKTAAVRIDLPNGSISLNAQPWAEVWIDGERIGETPIGNLQRPIGRHEIVFRHPELGERRQSVTLGLLEPVRLGIDMRKK